MKCACIKRKGEGMLPQLCGHRYAATGMLQWVCCSGYAATGMPPRVCCHGYAATGTMPSRSTLPSIRKPFALLWIQMRSDLIIVIFDQVVEVDFDNFNQRSSASVAKFIVSLSNPSMESHCQEAHRVTLGCSKLDLPRSVLQGCIVSQQFM